MVLKHGAKNAQEAKNSIRDMNSKGFRVHSITSRPTEGQNASSHFIDEVWLSTPYTYENKPLLGYCNVQHKGINDSVMVHTFELWTQENGVPQENLEDVYENEHGTRDWVVDDLKNEASSVTSKQAEQSVADCAVSTVYFPHVMTYDEYMAFQTSNMERLKMPSPTEASYEKYLDKCRNELKSGTIPYVGEILDADDVDRMSMTIPSVQRDLAELDVQDAHDFDSDFVF